MSDNTPIHGEFCWNELMTSDAGKAKEFYSKLLGWTFNDIDMGGSTYTMFKTGDKEIAGMMQIPQEQSGQIPPHWMSYINVTDLDATLEQVKQLGAEITVPATPVGDFGRLAMVIDPTGAQIALWQSTKS